MAVLAALVCSHLAAEPNKQMACEKAHAAISAQYHIDQKVQRVTKEVEEAAREAVGETASGIAVGAYTILASQEARVTTGAIPMVQSTVLTVKLNSINIKLLWDF